MRLWLGLLVLLMCPVFTVASSGNSSDSLRLRYGTVSTIALNADQHQLRLQAKTIAHLTALAINLYRVSVHSQTDYVIIESQLAGLHCQHDYRVLQLNPDQSYQLSPVFGQCTQLSQVQYPKQQLLIETQDPEIAGKATKQHRYRLQSGRVIEL